MAPTRLPIFPRSAGKSVRLFLYEATHEERYLFRQKVIFFMKFLTTINFKSYSCDRAIVEVLFELNIRGLGTFLVKISCVHAIKAVHRHTKEEISMSKLVKQNFNELKTK